MNSTFLTGFFSILYFILYFRGDCRADPNVMSETGFTSLILAAAGGHLEVVKTLVEKVR